MSEKHSRVILNDDVFALTAKGQNELRGSATSLPRATLEVLVLIDAKSTVGETAGRARTIGHEVVVNILAELLQNRFIEPVKDQPGALDFVDFFQSTGPITLSAAAAAKAKKDTAATTLLLQQHGYFVRIVRRAKTRKEPEGAGTLSVMVIEDEPHLAKLLQHVLTNEGFVVRAAKNRDEIVAEFRRPPRPDLVLLDVSLPDADGFDVLQRIRQHPALKTIPVVMLTAKATRDGVLKGLTGGADGYITKPFEIDALVKAVKVVLGLSDGAPSADTSDDPWGV